MKKVPSDIQCARVLRATQLPVVKGVKIYIYIEIPDDTL